MKKMSVKLAVVLGAMLIVTAVMAAFIFLFGRLETGTKSSTKQTAVQIKALGIFSVVRCKIRC